MSPPETAQEWPERLWLCAWRSLPCLLWCNSHRLRRPLYLVCIL
jgi:hypothetical protein